MANKLILSINSLQYGFELITFRGGYINSVERLNQQETVVLEEATRDVVEHFKCHEQKSEAYRFSNPSSDPLWAAAMSVVLFFTTMSIIGTTLDTYFVLADKHFVKTTGKRYFWAHSSWTEVYAKTVTIKAEGNDNLAYEPASPDEKMEPMNEEQMTDFGLMSIEPSKTYPKLAKFAKIFSVSRNLSSLFNTYRPKAVIKVQSNLFCAYQ